LPVVFSAHGDALKHLPRPQYCVEEDGLMICHGDRTFFARLKSIGTEADSVGGRGN